MCSRTQCARERAVLENALRSKTSCARKRIALESAQCSRTQCFREHAASEKTIKASIGGSFARYRVLEKWG
eukprot:15454545-Alexandrium_andersonii.AAC.1